MFKDILLKKCLKNRIEKPGLGAFFSSYGAAARRGPAGPVRRGQWAGHLPAMGGSSPRHPRARWLASARVATWRPATIGTLTFPPPRGARLPVMGGRRRSAMAAAKALVRGFLPADAPRVPAAGTAPEEARAAARDAPAAALAAPPRAPRCAESPAPGGVAGAPSRRRPWPRWWNTRGSRPATTAATATPRRARRPAACGRTP